MAASCIITTLYLIKTTAQACSACIQIMTHTLNWESNRLIRKFTGDVGAEEILKSNFDLQVHPKFATIKYIINDFTDVEHLLVQEEHTKIYASTDDVISDTKGHFKIAIVTTKDEHIELAKAYRAAMKNNLFECEIFSTVEEAQKWGES